MNKDEQKHLLIEMMTPHELKGQINEVMNELKYGFTDYDEAADRLLIYAEQFKEGVEGQKEAFTIEDMRAAFYAGKDHTADEYRDGETIGFDEWIKTRKK